MTRFSLFLALPIVLIVLLRPVFAAGQDWALYGGEGGRRFSTLAQITRTNVAQLRQAWHFDIQADKRAEQGAAYVAFALPGH